MSRDFVRHWVRLAAILGAVFLVVSGFVAGIDWATAEVLPHPWDDLVSSVVLVLALSFGVTFMMARDRRGSS